MTMVNVVIVIVIVNAIFILVIPIVVIVIPTIIILRSILGCRDHCQPGAHAVRSGHV